MRGAEFIRCRFDQCIASGAKFRNGSLAGSLIVGGDVLDQELHNTILEGAKSE